MGAERITGGIKAEQLITILHKADIKNVAREPLSDEKMLLLISNYLTGWENAVESKIGDRDPSLGAFSKIAGIRFMIYMLPTFFEQATKERSPFTDLYVTQKINQLFAAFGMLPRDLFDKNSDYYASLESNPFSAETPITIFAKDWSNKLKSLSLGTFDPLA